MVLRSTGTLCTLVNEDGMNKFVNIASKFNISLVGISFLLSGIQIESVAGSLMSVALLKKTKMERPI